MFDELAHSYKIEDVKKLAAMKDAAQISDDNWRICKHTLNLGKNSSLHSIKKQNREIIDLDLQKTTDNTTEIDLHQLITKYINEHYQKDNQGVLEIKLSLFDGARMTKRSSHIIGTVQFEPSKLNKNLAKSYRSSSIFGVFKGKESDANFCERELPLYFRFIRSLDSNLEVMINGVKVRVVHVADLKMMQIILGTGNRIHPNSNYKCPYCDVTKADFNSTPEHWETTKCLFAKVHGPISLFPICLSHLISATVKFFLKTIDEHLDFEMRRSMVQILIKNKLKLPKLLDPKTKLIDLLDCNFTMFPGWIKVLNSFPEILEFLKPNFNGSKEVNLILLTLRKYYYMEKSIAIFYVLLKVLVTYDPISESEYKNYSLWMLKSILEYSTMKITPYIHIIVYHAGYYENLYPKLINYSSFSIDNYHNYLKNVNNNGFHRKPGKKDYQYQLIHYSYRDKIYRDYLLQRLEEDNLKAPKTLSVSDLKWTEIVIPPSNRDTVLQGLMTAADYNCQGFRV